MCDYSLMMIHNRLAVEGEDLVAHRFRSGSTGMVSRFDFAEWHSRRCVSFWQKLKDCFWCPPEPAPVVCLPPGTRLRLTRLPRSLRDEFGLDSCEDATFTQVSAEENQHRDALLFANGATILLQLLSDRQPATVLRLPGAEAIQFDPELVETA